MEFNYLVEKKRMIKSLGNIDEKCCDGKVCKTCPLSSNKNGCYVSCSSFEIEHPLEATEIVRKWAEEHPIKTRKDVLLEKFPNAKLKDKCGGYLICAKYLGLCSDCENNNCFECWNKGVEE